MRPTITVALVLLTLLGGAACRKEAVHNVSRPMLALPRDLTSTEMADAIAAGAERASWRVREIGPGQMRAEKTFNRHRALSDISYDGASYSVTLLSADNLLYDGVKIHKIYNRWVEQLQKGIADELRFRYP
jgi:hypothetical protein